MSDPAALRQHPLAAALHEALARHRDLVLQAPTGAGKSTGVPLLLLPQLVAGQKILMLEPRRLATRAVAARMAWLLQQPLGGIVGYRMRLDTRVSAATRIEVVTEGVLTRMLQTDPSLQDIAYLIFDEFHERSLAADTGLALALDARRQLEAGFRILVMSATIDGQSVAALLGDAALVSVPGRAFPVDVQYVGRALPLLPDPRQPQALERAATNAVMRALQETSGDVLVFMPGVGEIRRLETLLRQSDLPACADIVALYGEMRGADQDAALAPAAAGRRKLVIATNVAETSLTIPGVTAVIDSGLVRRSRFDPGTGMSRLELMRISRASSDQRAGRAGRVSAGLCLRLWSESAQPTLAADTAPEILEADLAPLALELARWGADDAAQLSWLDPPPAPALQQARELLLRLGALDERARLSALGRQMASLSVHPRLAHMLLLSRRWNVLPLAARLAALLSERDLLRRGTAERDADVRTRLELFDAGARRERIDGAVLERVRRSAAAFEQAVRSEPASAVTTDRALSESEAVGVLLALAYPDRIGQRRDSGNGRYLLSNGRGAAFMHADSLAREAYIVAVELDDREREARIDLAAPLSLALIEKLLADQLETQEQYGWEPEQSALLARRVRRLGALVIDQQLLPPPTGERAIEAMLSVIRQHGLQALPWSTESRTLQARMQFVSALQRRDLSGWPDSDDAALLAQLPQWLGPYLHSVTRLEHLARVPLVDALLARLSVEQRRALEKLAPRELVVPTGTHVRIDYLDESAPSVAVRLQEVFGVVDTPRIGEGSVPLTFKLLSPAQRPLQITRDLAGFWRSSYFEVRKDMRGRYPKHHWPEDPLQATPTRRAKPRPVKDRGN